MHQSNHISLTSKLDVIFDLIAIETNDLFIDPRCAIPLNTGHDSIHVAHLKHIRNNRQPSFYPAIFGPH